MEKVKLPKDVAKAIEALRSRDFEVTNHDILFIFAESYNNGYPALVKFSQKHFDTLLEALVNGYEVEQTPEDKVREYYKFYIEPTNEFEEAIKIAIERTLNLLNIKIEGVNS